MTRSFKLVTEENWLGPDPLSALIVKLDHRDGSVTPVDGRDWIAFINRITLGENVPQDIRTAYEFAAGAIGYAYFYYPIFTIVIQQLLRIADFAIAHLFEVKSDLPAARTFQQRITILKNAGVLDSDTSVRWDAVRKLRNEATHPSWQQNWGYSFLDVVKTIVELISALPWPIQEGA